MKKQTLSLAAFLLVLLGFVLVDCNKAKAADNGFWWHNLLTQQGRNAAIVNAALSYPDGYKFTGDGECKGWVKTVVLAASGNVVSIPPNANDSTWQASPNVGQDYPAFPASGEIIQMHWNTTLHTMIVLSSGPAGMNVIDCNWYKVDPRNPQKSAVNCVFRHSITWTEFRAKATAYSVYYIK